MSTPRYARAVQLAAQLDGAGLPATADPAAVLGKAPCALIGPPRLSFDTIAGPTAEWRLLLVAGTTSELAAWQQLDELLDQLDVAGLVESAEPARYATDDGGRPAYACTYTETVPNS